MMNTAETIFSLEEGVPRAAPADATGGTPRAGLQAGAIARGSLRELCFLRKVTPLGAELAVLSPVKVGERLDLSLLTGDKLSGEVDWVRGDAVGLRFDAAADVFGLITRNLVQQPGDARAMPRVELHVPAMLEVAGRHHFVDVINLSGGGVGIAGREALPPNAPVTLLLDQLPPISGTIRWQRGEAAGIAFDVPLGWETLMPWLRRQRQAATAAPGKAAQAAATVPAPPTAGPADGSIGLNLAARVREGSRRWTIEVKSIDTHQVRFISYAALEPGRMFWISLPGLAGWPSRITDVEGDQVTCAFTQPLHPAVLERVLAMAGSADPAGRA